MFRGVYTSNYDSSQINFSIGTELKHDNIKSLRVTNRQQNIADYAIFGSIKYSPIQSIKIQPAVRYAYNSKYKAPLVPSVSMLANLNDNFTIRASYAKGFRAPSLKELYLEFHYNSTINLWGSEKLKSENSDHLNLSFDFQKSAKKHNFKFSPKAYYSKINNLISLVQTSPVDWTYGNVDYLITQGASFNFNYNYRKTTIKAAYNYYGNYNSQFDQAEIENTFFYSNDITAGIEHKLDSIDLSIRFDYKYTGTLKNYFINDNNVIQQSLIGDYSIFDLSLTKSLMNKQMTFTTGVKNLLNVKDVKMVGEIFGVSNSNNATSLNVLWGRSIFVSLNYKF